MAGMVIILVSFIGCPDTSDPVTGTELSTTLKTTTFSSLDDLQNALKGVVYNTVQTPYQVTLTDLDMAAFGTDTDGLARLFACLEGRFVSIDAAACTGTSIDAAPSAAGSRHNADKLVAFIPARSTLSIGAYAFAGCTSLETVTLPALVGSIGDGAFAGCVSLAFTVASGNTAFSTGEKGRMLLSNQGATLCAYPAAPAKSRIASSITAVRDYAFSGASGLRELTIDPASPPTLGGSHVFENTTILSFKVPREQIPQYKNAAYWKDYAPRIGSSPDWHEPAFTSLTDLGTWVAGLAANDPLTPYYAVLKNIPLSNKGTGERLDDGLRKLYDTFNGKYIALDIDACSGATLGYSDLYDQTFVGRPDRDKIVQVILPSSATVVGIYNFYNCISLEEVTFPAGLKQINKYAFSGCSSLREIDLPASFNLFGASAFAKCTNLERVTVRASVPPAISGGVFDGVSDKLTFYVPAGSMEAYKAMPSWKPYEKRIRAIP